MSWGILKADFHQVLDPIFGDSEVNALFELSAHTISGLKKHERLPSSIISPMHFNALKRVCARLEKKEPIQYILGFAPFLDEDFIVGSGVLIPRPETAWIVHSIIQDNHFKNQQFIVDVCSGSGCMGITLAKHWPQAEVLLVDHSAIACDYALMNRNKILSPNHHISILQSDVLTNNDYIQGTPTLIVSNPPYIPIHEKEHLSDWVIQHEPADALFPPGNDPLLFYKAISHVAFSTLAYEGSLVMEIHEDYGKECLLILENAGFSNVLLKQDLSEKDRFIIGLKK